MSLDLQCSINENGTYIIEWKKNRTCFALGLTEKREDSFFYFYDLEKGKETAKDSLIASLDFAKFILGE